MKRNFESTDESFKKLFLRIVRIGLAQSGCEVMLATCEYFE